MTITKINESDISSLKVSSLPSRPTAPTSFGGAGYSAKQMKEAFDRLPLYIISKLNALIDAISAVGEEGISSAVPTGITDSHSLSDLFSDVTSGELASYLCVLGTPLSEIITDIRESLNTLSLGLGESTGVIGDFSARIEDAEQSIESALIKLDGIDSAVESISPLLSAHESDIESIHSLITELRATCASGSEAIAALSGRIDELKSTHEKDIEELGNSAGALGDISIDCGSPADL